MPTGQKRSWGDALESDSGLGWVHVVHSKVRTGKIWHSQNKERRCDDTLKATIYRGLWRVVEGCGGAGLPNVDVDRAVRVFRDSTSTLQARQTAGTP